MASFLDCIQKKSDEGLLSKRQVTELENRYRELVGRYARNMGDIDAAHAAAQKVVEIETSKIAKKKRNSIQHAIRTKEIIEDIKAKGVTPDLYARDLYESTYIRYQQVEKNITSYLNEFGEEFDENFLGTGRNLEGIEDVVKEVMGQKTNNATASKLGRAVNDTFEYAHARYEAAGGIQGYTKNYFPVSHKKEAIKAVDFNVWAKEIKDRIDLESMISPETGLPMSPDKIDDVLEMHYDAIVNGPHQDVMTRIEQGLTQLGGARRKETDIRRDLSRFYKWKSPEDFLAYNEKFGTGREGLYGVIPNYIRSMSRDIAMMEKISPNPEAMSKNLDALMKAGKVGPVDRQWTNGMYHVLSGATDGWAGEPSHWYSALAGAQNWIRSSVLGAASISAIADSGFIITTARINNLSATRMMGKYAAQMKPASSFDRQIAKRNGYLVELVSGSALSDTRFAGETAGLGKITQWLSGFTNKFSGLGAMTKANATAVSLEAEATFGELVKAGVTWEGLDKGFRETLEAHEFTPEDWAFISKAKPIEHPGSGSVFLRSRDIVESATVDEVKREAVKKTVSERAQKLIDTTNNRVMMAEDAHSALDEIERITAENPEATPKELKKLLEIPKAELAPRLKELEIKAKKMENIRLALDQVQATGDIVLKNAQKELEGADKFAAREAGTEAFRKAQKVADKLDDWIYTMRQQSTNEPNLRSKSITTGAFLTNDPSSAKKGTMIRALASSVFMFKSFGITNLFTHIIPAMKSAAEGARGVARGNFGDIAKMEHAALAAVTTTLLGALAIQGKELSKGRETRSMKDPAFWKAAAMQGGGFGLFGDFMFSGTSRFGRDPLIEAMGPVAGLGSDVYKMVKGEYDQAVDLTLEGKPTKDVNLLRDLFKLVKRNVPAVNLWYSRLIVERLFMDQIEKMIDPKAPLKWQKSENAFYKDTGQKLYWRRGEMLPKNLK